MKKILGIVLTAIFVFFTFAVAGCKGEEKIYFSVGTEYDRRYGKVELSPSYTDDGLYEYHEHVGVTVTPNEGYCIEYYFRSAEWAEVRSWEVIKNGSTYKKYHYYTDTFPVTQKCTIIVSFMPIPDDDLQESD